MSIRARIRQVRRRLRADAQKGSAAIEFAFVAPVFFVLLLGIFEAAILFFTQEVLQSAMGDMGRMIRTGQTSCYTTGNGGACQSMTQTQFRALLCQKVAPLIPCNGNLQIDVEAFNGYTSVTYSPPLTAGVLNTALNNFQLGGACDVVLARAFYTWPVVTPVLTWFLVNTADNKHLMTGATAFRNEPYTNGASGC